MGPFDLILFYYVIFNVFSLWLLVTTKRPQHSAVVGLSVLAERPMDSRLSVRQSVRRPFVSHTLYLKNCASDFDEFLCRFLKY